MQVERAHVEHHDAAVASYPGGLRPTSTVTLAGAGSAGRGEHVGWTPEAHTRFADRTGAAALAGRHSVGALSAALRELFPEPYDRAALEAAAIDLALAQSRVGLGEIAGIAPRPVRYVVSFDALGDTLARMCAERRLRASAEFKLDVDPRWEDALLDAIAAEGGVAVLDFKGGGATADHERFARRFPDALLEDALAPETLASAELRLRASFDAPVVSADALAAIDPPPAAVNVKPARMGGVLEAVAAVSIASRRGLRSYFGGMFEVGVGRLQLRALASLLCPDGPNDIAPITSGERPERLEPAGGGSGFVGPRG